MFVQTFFFDFIASICRVVCSPIDWPRRDESSKQKKKWIIYEIFEKIKSNNNKIIINNTYVSSIASNH